MTSEVSGPCCARRAALRSPRTSSRFKVRSVLVLDQVRFLRPKTLRNAWKRVEAGTSWELKLGGFDPIFLIATGDDAWERLLSGTFTRESDVAEALIARALQRQVNAPEHMRLLSALGPGCPEKLARSSLLGSIKRQVTNLVRDAAMGGRWEPLWTLATGDEVAWDVHVADGGPWKRLAARLPKGGAGSPSRRTDSGPLGAEGHFRKHNVDVFIALGRQEGGQAPLC